jgi:hypothetical protein
MTYEVKGNKLIITVDISDAALAAAKPSASGKTRVVASTGGFMAATPSVKFGLNVTTK